MKKIIPVQYKINILCSLQSNNHNVITGLFQKPCGEIYGIVNFPNHQTHMIPGSEIYNGYTGAPLSTNVLQSLGDSPKDSFTLIWKQKLLIIPKLKAEGTFYKGPNGKPGVSNRTKADYGVQDHHIFPQEMFEGNLPGIDPKRVEDLRWKLEKFSIDKDHQHNQVPLQTPSYIRNQIEQHQTEIALGVPLEDQTALPTNYRVPHTKHDDDYQLMMFEWAERFFNENSDNPIEKVQELFYNTIKEEFAPRLLDYTRDDAIFLGTASREAAQELLAYTERANQEGFRESNVGGITNSVGQIHGLENLFSNAYQDAMQFAYRIPSEGLSMSFAEIQQIMREVQDAVTKNVPLFFSLSNKSQGCHEKFPVIHPNLEHTLTGRTMAIVDYYMKSLWTGKYVELDILDQYAKGEISSEQIKSHYKEIKHLLVRLNINESYKNESEIIEEMGLNEPVEDNEINVMNSGTQTRFWIEAKQRSFDVYDNTFLISPGFNVNYELKPSNELLEFMAEYEREHGRQYPQYLKYEEATKVLIKQKEDIMPKLPFLKKHFELLGVINFFANLFTNLSDKGVSPHFSDVKKPSNEGVPRLFPGQETLSGGCSMAKDTHELTHNNSISPIVIHMLQHCASLEADEHVTQNINGQDYLIFKLNMSLNIDVKNVPYTEQSLVPIANESLTVPENMVLHGLRFKDLKMVNNYLNLDRNKKHQIQADKPIHNGQTCLHYAYIHNCESIAKRLIEEFNFDVFVKDDKGLNAFLYAISYASENHIKWLIESFNPIDKSSDSFNRNALYIAASMGRENIVNLLFDSPRSLNIFQCNTSGFNPLTIAIYNEFEAIAIQIVRHVDTPEKLNSKINEDNWTALHFAAEKNMHKLIKNLIEKEALILGDRNGATPIHIAVKSGHIESTQALIHNMPNKKDELNKRLNTGETPLMIAAHNGHHEIVKQLCNDCDVNIKNKLGETAIMIAIKYAHLESIRALIPISDERITNKDGDSFIDLIFQMGLLEVIPSLSESQRKDIFTQDKKDRFDWHPIHYVIRTDNVLRYQELIAHYPKCKSFKSGLGLTHFEFALYLGKNLISSFLYDQVSPSDLKKTNHHGLSCIHFAAKSGHLSIMRTYLSNKDNNVDFVVEKGNQSGKSLAYIAAENGQAKILELLIAKGANLKSNFQNRHILYPAIVFGDKASVDCIVLKMGALGIDINEKLDLQGTRAGHLIVKLGDVELLDHLIERGLNLSQENNENVIPYHLALENNQEKIIKYFELKQLKTETKYNDWVPAIKSENNNVQRLIQSFVDKVNNGYNINQIDWASKKTPATLAAEYQKHQILSHLHKTCHADLLESDGNHETIFHVMIRKKNLTPLKEYLEKVDSNLTQTFLKELVVFGINHSALECVALCINMLSKKSWDRSNNSEDISEWVRLAAGAKDMILMLTKPTEWDNEKRNIFQAINELGGDTTDDEALPMIYEKVLNLFKKDQLYLFLDESTGVTYYSSILRLATWRCKFDFAKELIERFGYDPNGLDEDLHSISHMISFSPHVKAHKPLWRLLDWTKMCSHGHSPIQRASDSEFKILIDFLFDEMESKLPERVDNKGNTLVHLAATNNKLDNMKNFLKNGVSPNIRNFKEQTPIMFAAQNGKHDMIKMLTLYGGNLFEKDPETGNSLLQMTIKNKHYDTALFLIQSNVDCTSENKLNQNALHTCAQNGTLHLIPLLIDNGASLLARDSRGYMPFHYAIENKHKDIIDLLLKDNSVINSPVLMEETDDDRQIILDNQYYEDIEGLSPLHLAAKVGDVSIMNLLLNAGADQLSVTKSGESFGVYAAKYGHLDAFQLAWNYEITKEDSQISKIIFMASRSNKLEILEFLIKEGISVENILSFGFSAVSIASSNGYSKMLKRLLQCSEPVFYDDQKCHAIEHAVSYGHLNVTKLLLKNDPKLVDYQTKNKETLLILACKKNVNDVLIAYLIKSGINVNAYSSTGNTALYYAGMSDNINATNLLLIAGADPEHKNFTDKTLLQAAYDIKGEDYFNVLKKSIEESKKGATPIERALALGLSGYIDLFMSMLQPGENNQKTDALYALVTSQLSKEIILTKILKVDSIKTRFKDNSLNDVNSTFELIKAHVVDQYNDKITNQHNRYTEEIDRITEKAKIMAIQNVQQKMARQLTDDPDFFKKIQKKKADKGKSYTIEKITDKYQEKLYENEYNQLLEEFMNSVDDAIT